LVKQAYSERCEEYDPSLRRMTAPHSTCTSRADRIAGKPPMVNGTNGTCVRRPVGKSRIMPGCRIAVVFLRVPMSTNRNLDGCSRRAWMSRVSALEIFQIEKSKPMSENTFDEVQGSLMDAPRVPSARANGFPTGETGRGAPREWKNTLYRLPPRWNQELVPSS